MGYRVAKACTLTNDPPISDRARIILIRMGWAVLDKPSPNNAAAEYWGGWEYLSLSWPGLNTEARKRLVMRALAELVANGYLKPLGVAHLGQRQHYVITVDW